MKCLCAHLAFLSFLGCGRRGGSPFPTCCELSIKETQSHLRDMVPATSSTDSRLPGSLNVWDLSVSISQLISLVHLATASAAHSFCGSVPSCSHYPTQGGKSTGSRGKGNASVGTEAAATTVHTHPRKTGQLLFWLVCAAGQSDTGS